MTSRRGRGEDSVYLDGDRWREVQPHLVTGPTGAGSARRLVARRKAKCFASCEICGPNSMRACQFLMTG
jgi:hypothetical protein